eukprot:GHRR01000040.1.p1 GENE.GHRR01000040.1~~GHRR01000040.1.p1  ORF type:complete len:4009 (+),score=-479.29 GHRR01000040.1:2478-14504(+)
MEKKSFAFLAKTRRVFPQPSSSIKHLRPQHLQSATSKINTLISKNVFFPCEEQTFGNRWSGFANLVNFQSPQVHNSAVFSLPEPQRYKLSRAEHVLKAHRLKVFSNQKIGEFFPSKKNFQQYWIFPLLGFVFFFCSTSSFLDQPRFIDKKTKMKENFIYDFESHTNKLQQQLFIKMSSVFLPKADTFGDSVFPFLVTNSDANISVEKLFSKKKKQDCFTHQNNFQFQRSSDFSHSYSKQLSTENSKKLRKYEKTEYQKLCNFYLKIFQYSLTSFPFEREKFYSCAPCCTLCTIEKNSLVSTDANTHMTSFNLYQTNQLRKTLEIKRNVFDCTWFSVKTASGSLNEKNKFSNLWFLKIPQKAQFFYGNMKNFVFSDVFKISDSNSANHLVGIQIHSKKKEKFSPLFDFSKSVFLLNEILRSPQRDRSSVLTEIKPSSILYSGNPFWELETNYISPHTAMRVESLIDGEPPFVNDVHLFGKFNDNKSGFFLKDEKLNSFGNFQNKTFTNSFFLQKWLQTRNFWKLKRKILDSQTKSMTFFGNQQPNIERLAFNSFVNLDFLYFQKIFDYFKTPICLTELHPLESGNSVHSSFQTQLKSCAENLWTNGTLSSSIANSFDSFLFPFRQGNVEELERKNTRFFKSINHSMQSLRSRTFNNISFPQKIHTISNKNLYFSVNFKKSSFEFFVFQYYKIQYQHLLNDLKLKNQFLKIGNCLPNFHMFFDLMWKTHKIFNTFQKNKTFSKLSRTSLKKQQLRDLKEKISVFSSLFSFSKTMQQFSFDYTFYKNFSVVNNQMHTIHALCKKPIFQNLSKEKKLKKFQPIIFTKPLMDTKHHYFSGVALPLDQLKITFPFVESECDTKKNSMSSASIRRLELPILFDFSAIHLNSTELNSFSQTNKFKNIFLSHHSKNNIHDFYNGSESRPSSLSSNYFNTINSSEVVSKNIFSVLPGLNRQKFLSFSNIQAFLIDRQNGQEKPSLNNRIFQKNKTSKANFSLINSMFSTSKIVFLKHKAKNAEKFFKNFSFSVKRNFGFTISSFEFFKKSFFLGQSVEKAKQQKGFVFENHENLCSTSLVNTKKTIDSTIKFLNLIEGLNPKANSDFQEKIQNLKRKALKLKSPTFYVLKYKKNRIYRRIFSSSQFYKIKLKNKSSNNQNFIFNFQSRKFEKVFQTFLSPLSKEKFQISSFNPQNRLTRFKTTKINIQKPMSALKSEKDLFIVENFSSLLQKKFKNVYSDFIKKGIEKEGSTFLCFPKEKSSEYFTHSTESNKFKKIRSVFFCFKKEDVKKVNHTVYATKALQNEKKVQEFQNNNFVSASMILKRDGFLFYTSRPKFKIFNGLNDRKQTKNSASTNLLLSETSIAYRPVDSENNNLSFQRLEREKSLQKKRRMKKQKLETRRRKKRKRFYPRPLWLRLNIYKKFLQSRHPGFSHGFSTPEVEHIQSSSFVTPRDKIRVKAEQKQVQNNQHESGIQKIYRKNRQQWGFVSRTTAKNKRREKMLIQKISSTSTVFNKPNFDILKIPISQNIEDYKISGDILSEFLRLSWKSYWFQTNFQPYTRRIAKNFKKIREVESKKSFSQYSVFNLLGNTKYPFVFSGFPTFQDHIHKDFQNKLILKKFICEKFLWYCNLQYSFERNPSVYGGNKNSLNLQRIQNFPEYNRILYARVSEVLKNLKSSEIQDELSMRFLSLPDYWKIKSTNKDQQNFKNSKYNTLHAENMSTFFGAENTNENSRFSFLTKLAVFSENFNIPSQPTIPAFSLFSSLFRDFSIKPTGELPTLRALWAFHQTNLYDFQQNNAVHSLWTLKKRTDSLKSFKGTKKIVSFFRNYSGLDRFQFAKTLKLFSDFSNSKNHEHNGKHLTFDPQYSSFDFQRNQSNDEKNQTAHSFLFFMQKKPVKIGLFPQEKLFNKKMWYLSKMKSGSTDFIDRFDNMCVQKFMNVQKKCSIFGINTLKQHSKNSLRYLKFILLNQVDKESFLTKQLFVKNKKLLVSQRSWQPLPNQQNSAKSSLNFWWAQKNYLRDKNVFQFLLSAQTVPQTKGFVFMRSSSFEQTKNSSFLYRKAHVKYFEIETQLLWFGAIVFHLAILFTVFKLPEIRSVFKFQCIVFYKVFNSLFLIVFSIHNLFEKYTKKGTNVAHKIFKVCSNEEKPSIVFSHKNNQHITLSFFDFMCELGKPNSSQKFDNFSVFNNVGFTTQPSQSSRFPQFSQAGGLEFSKRHQQVLRKLKQRNFSFSFSTKNQYIPKKNFISVFLLGEQDHNKPQYCFTTIQPDFSQSIQPKSFDMFRPLSLSKIKASFKIEKNTFIECFVRVSKFSKTFCFFQIHQHNKKNIQKYYLKNSALHLSIPNFSEKANILKKQNLDKISLMRESQIQPASFAFVYGKQDLQLFPGIWSRLALKQTKIQYFHTLELFFMQGAQNQKKGINFKSTPNFKKFNNISNTEKFMSELALSLLLFGKYTTLMSYSFLQYASKISGKIFDIVEKILFSIYKFLEKPAELMIEWIALIFLIEWSSDIATFVPDSFDISLSKTSKKLVRPVRSGSLILSFLSVQPHNLFCSFPNVVISSTLLNSFGFLIYSNLTSFVIQKRILYFFENFSSLLIQPDMDILVRQKKGMIFWDIWAEILLKAAEKYNVNIPSLVTLKEEQELFIEKLLQDRQFLSAYFTFREDERSNSVDSTQNKKIAHGESFQQNSFMYFIENFVGKERPRKLTFDFFPKNYHIRQSTLSNLPFFESIPCSSNTFQSHPLSLSSQGVHFDHEIPHIDATDSSTFFQILEQHRSGSSPENLSSNLQNQKLARVQWLSQILGFVQKDSSPFHYISSQFNKHPFFQASLAPHTQNDFSFDFSGRFDRWSCNQYGTYQSPETDLFIDIHPPKSLHHIRFFKYYEPAQYTLGSLICQVYSGLFSKQVSKNILVIGAPRTAKTLFIQALAGETEMKIITENAYRYATVQRGVAVGMKYLRDVFDAIALQTPCFFLMEHIHVIGSKRPFLISDDENVTQSSFGLEQQEVHETNQMIYQLSRHSISDYKRPYKGDFSMRIPTNSFIQNFWNGGFSKTTEKKTVSMRGTQIEDSQFSAGGINLQSRQSPTYPLPIDSVEYSFGKTEKQGFSETTDTAFQYSFAKTNNYRNAGVGQSSTFQKSCLQIGKEQAFAPPATSPFTVLMMKEQKKLKPKKILQENSWGGLSADQIISYEKESHSVRAKVASLAHMTMNLSRGKFDMITDLLVIIDNVRSNRGFVVFATTHVPSLLDPALRRPGRFDETLTLSQSPNFMNRFEILKMNFEHSVNTFDFLDSSIVTENFSEINLLNFMKITKLSLFHQYKYSTFLEPQTTSQSRSKQMQIISQVSPAKAFNTFLKSSHFHDLYAQLPVTFDNTQRTVEKVSMLQSNDSQSFNHSKQIQHFSEIQNVSIVPVKNSKQSSTLKVEKIRSEIFQKYFLRSTKLFRYTILPKQPSHTLSLAYSKIGVFVAQANLLQNPTAYTPLNLDGNTLGLRGAQNQQQFNQHFLYDSQKRQQLQLMVFMAGKVGEFFVQNNSQIIFPFGLPTKKEELHFLQDKSFDDFNEFNKLQNQTINFNKVRFHNVQHKLGMASQFNSTKQLQSKFIKIVDNPSELFEQKFSYFVPLFQKGQKSYNRWASKSGLIDSRNSVSLFMPKVEYKPFSSKEHGTKLALCVQSTSKNGKLSSFMRQLQKNDFFWTAFGNNELWRFATPFVFSIIQKRFLFTKNLLLSKMIFFDNKNQRKQPPSPPTSSILMPSKKYENFKRTEKDFFEKSRFSMNEKIQMHQQQRFLKQLYNIPVQQYFRSESVHKRRTFFSSSFQELAYLNSFTSTSSSSHFYYRKYLGKRHRFSNINQWWNGFLPEHNTETTYLSDVDWRTMFVNVSRQSNSRTEQNRTEPSVQNNCHQMLKNSTLNLGSDKSTIDTFEFTMDFPDAEQYYNPRNRRWYFYGKSAREGTNYPRNFSTNRKNNFSYWLTFDVNLQYEIYYHFLMHSFHESFHYFDEQREMVDYFVFHLLRKGFLKELDFLTTNSRF